MIPRTIPDEPGCLVRLDRSNFHPPVASLRWWKVVYWSGGSAWQLSYASADAPGFHLVGALFTSCPDQWTPVSQQPS